MSLGGGFDQGVNDAVTRSIADGVVYSLAAGNSNANACNYSPAATPDAITVGATTSTDARASYSNWGTCLDIFAPGSSTTSAWHGSINVLHSRSGSSTDNIVETYTRDLSVEVANGTWKLRVQDSASLDTGYLDSWTLSL